MTIKEEYKHYTKKKKLHFKKVLYKNFYALKENVFVIIFILCFSLIAKEMLTLQFNYAEQSNQLNLANERIAILEDKVKTLEIEYNSVNDLITSYTTAEEYLSEETVTMIVPNIDTSFYSWMCYSTITDKSSEQYEMQSTLAYTDAQGFRRIGEDYCVAMGSYYTNYDCGSRYKITLDNHYTFTVVIADIKQDIHTDPTNSYVEHNGNVIEFIVDSKVMPKKALTLGNLGWYYPELQGEILSIEKITE